MVGSNTGPVREVIEEGVHGLLTDFFDVSALAARVVSVLKGRAEWDQLCLMAQKKIVDEYDLQAVCLPGQLRIVAGL